MFAEVRVRSGTNWANYTIVHRFRELSWDSKYLDAGALNIAVPTADAASLGIQDLAVIEIAPNGSSAINSWYYIDGSSGSKIADDELWTTFSGKSLDAMLDVEAKVYPSAWPSATPAGHSFLNATAGTIVQTLVARAQARGAITWLDVSTFTGATTSNSTGWASTVTLTYDNGTGLFQVLMDLAARGMISWRMNGRQLLLYNLDELVSHKTADQVTVRRGLSITEETNNTDSSTAATAVLVVGDQNQATERTSATNLTAFGRRRESYVAQAGITDIPTLQMIGDRYLTLGHIRSEESLAVTDATGPWTNYQVGDWIWEDLNGTLVNLQIAQLAATVQDENNLKIGLTLGDLLDMQDARTARTLQSITNGGGAIPSPVTNDGGVPSPPTAVGFTPTAYRDSNGNDFDQITVSWTAPTTNTDGSALSDLNHYDVQWTANGGTSWSTASSVLAGTTVAYFSSISAGQTVQFRVRAVDNAGNASTYATSTSQLLPGVTTTPATPSTPAVTSAFRGLIVTWDGKDSTGTAYPTSWARTEAHVSSTSGFTPSTATLVGAFTQRGGTLPVTGLAYSTTYYVKLVAVDKSGNASAASAQSSGTTAGQLSDPDLPAKLVQGAKIADNAISTQQLTVAAFGDTVAANGGFEDIASAAADTAGSAHWKTWTTSGATITRDTSTAATGTAATLITLSAGNMLSNGSFETGTTGWTPAACTLAQSSAQAFVGTKSMSMTATSTAMNANSPAVAVLPLTAYTAQLRMRANTTGRQWFCVIQWYDATMVALTQSASAGVNDVTTGWTQITVTATSPSNAAYASVYAVCNVTAAAEVHYLDAVKLEQGSTATAYADSVSAAMVNSDAIPTSDLDIWYVRFKAQASRADVVAVTAQLSTAVDAAHLLAVGDANNPITAFASDGSAGQLDGSGTTGLLDANWQTFEGQVLVPTGLAAPLKLCQLILTVGQPNDGATANVWIDDVTLAPVRGQAYIKDASIVSAKVVSLAADKIDAGTLTAITLDAGSMTGTMTEGDLGPSNIYGTYFRLNDHGGAVLLFATTPTVVLDSTTAGSSTYTPAGTAGSTVYAKVECWGGGGGGGAGLPGYDAGEGGGGGEYAREDSIALTAGTAYTFTVGAGGAGDTVGAYWSGASGSTGRGGDTTFVGPGLNVVAHGGKRGTGALQGSGGSQDAWGGTGSTNTVHFDGGKCGVTPIYHSGGNSGGGGGGGAGVKTKGKNGSGATGGAAVTDGGAGGNGGSSSTAGAAGSAPGGGGGGGGCSGTSGSKHNGGAGASGRIRITTFVFALVSSMAPAAGTDPLTGSTYPAGVRVGHPESIGVIGGYYTQRTYSQSIPNNSATALTAAPVDVQGGVSLDIRDSATSGWSSGVFTVPTGMSGIWTIHFQCDSLNSTATTRAFLSIRRNGSQSLARDDRNNVVAAPHTTAAAKVWLVAGDTIDFLLFQNSGGAVTHTGFITVTKE